MLETPHVALGALIAVKVGNPYLALPLSFLSHFALETLPHWNPHIFTEIKTRGKLSPQTLGIIAVDVATGLAIGLWVAFQNLPNIPKVALILTACFLAVLPDLIESPYFLFGVRRPFFERLIRFQRRFQFDVSPLPGLLVQTIVAILFLNLATH